MAYEFETGLEALPEHEHEFEEEFEEEMEHEAGLEGEGWLGAIGNVVGSLLGEEEMEEEMEHEHEHEHEEELEHEISPIRKIYPDAMMEHLGELAAEAETEDEAAEHFLPLIGMAASKLLPVVAKAAAPLARKLLPKVARAVTKAAPRLTKGVGQIARTLHRNPTTRHLLKTVPAIARRTVGSIAHQVARGRPITARGAIRTLARQTERVLGHPHRRRHALRQHNRMERRFHRAYGPGMARPHWRHGRRWQGRYPHWYWRRGRRGAPGYAAAPGYSAPGYAGPGYAGPGAPAPLQHPSGRVVVPGGGAAPVRYGQMVDGQCTCPTCGPQYCRCCGQVVR